MEVNSVALAIQWLASNCNNCNSITSSQIKLVARLVGKFFPSQQVADWCANHRLWVSPFAQLLLLRNSNMHFQLFCSCRARLSAGEATNWTAKRPLAALTWTNNIWVIVIIIMPNISTSHNLNLFHFSASPIRSLNKLKSSTRLQWGKYEIGSLC